MMTGSRYSLYYSVGLFSLIVCLIGSFLDRLFREIRENADLEAYKKIAFTDLMTGMHKNRFHIERSVFFLQHKHSCGHHILYVSAGVSHGAWIKLLCARIEGAAKRFYRILEAYFHLEAVR